MISEYWFLFLLPFLIQALAITVDEFYFHHNRRLGLWERIGHPLDTLTVVALYVFCIYAPTTTLNIYFYIGLAVFSCVFVTKDEFVHTKLCSASENWLHAILFLVHSVTAVVLGLMWLSPPTTSLGLVQFTVLDFMIGQTFILTLFLIYQILYWNKEWLWNK